MGQDTDTWFSSISDPESHACPVKVKVLSAENSLQRASESTHWRKTLPFLQLLPPDSFSLGNLKVWEKLA